MTRAVQMTAPSRAVWPVVGAVLFAACFPYLVMGVLPAWIVLGLACFLIAAARQEIGAALRLTPGVKAIVLAWLLLVIVSLVLDLVGFATRDVRTGPILNFVTLLMFIGILSGSTHAKAQTVILLLASITLLQGVVSLLQYIGVGWAWSLSSTLVSIVPFQPLAATVSYDAAFEEFASVGRVKGTHVYVHIYNGVNSALVAICTYMAVNPMRSLMPSRKLWLFLRVATLIGAVGILLSFSRSGILAIAGAVALTFLIRPRPVKVVVISLAMILLGAFLYSIDFSGSKQFSRLILAPQYDLNSQVRFDHIRHAIENFLKNPMVGESGVPNAITLELPIHSVPMRYLNDYGAAGLLLYGFIFIAIVAVFLKHMRSGDNARIFWGGAGLCLMLAIVADSWTHSSGLLRRDVVHAVLIALTMGQAARASVRAMQLRVTGQQPPPTPTRPIP
ncbi:O-antigen ligase family protein [Brevundimonas sp.]|uniref:O-antigen ligase family protein n=1 Tax=Brevundimonas sp. TaxID=1871086 RepID=UPI002FCBB28D